MKKKAIPLRAFLAFQILAAFIAVDCLAQGSRELDFEALFEVDFTDRANGWAVGRNAVIIHTSDGGQTWEVQHRSERQPEGILRSVSFADEKHGIAVGGEGLILRTDDGGEIWRPSGRIRNPYFGMELPKEEKEEEDKDQSSGEADESVEPQSDAGVEPQGEREDGDAPEERLTPEMVKDEFLPPGASAGAWFTDTQYTDLANAWILGGGVLLHSSDMGKSWSIVELPTGIKYSRMFFLNSKTGWVAGSGGTILKTVDAGETWKKIYLNDSWTLNDVFFLDGNVGWLSGESGLVMKTVDGGKSWVQQPTGIRQNISKITMLSNTHGFAIVSGGDPLRTVDGATWQTMSTGVDEGASEAKKKSEPLKALGFCFLNRSVGFMVGTWGLILSTKDGGDTWTQLWNKRFVERRILEAQKSLVYARGGVEIDTGYVHPVLKVAERFGPMFHLGASIVWGRGPFKFGGGLHVGLGAGREKIVVPQGILDDYAPVEMDTAAFMIEVPLDFRLMLFERKGWFAKLDASVGFRYEGLSPSGDRVDEIDEADYERDRIGLALSEALCFGYVVAVGRAPTRRVNRHALYLKAGLGEAWTWNVSGVREDLGEKDDKSLGTELWPFMMFSWGIYF